MPPQTPAPAPTPVPTSPQPNNDRRGMILGSIGYGLLIVPSFVVTFVLGMGAAAPNLDRWWADLLFNTAALGWLTLALACIGGLLCCIGSITPAKRAIWKVLMILPMVHLVVLVVVFFMQPHEQYTGPKITQQQETPDTSLAPVAPSAPNIAATGNAENGYTGTFTATPGAGNAPLLVQFATTIKHAGDESIDYGDGSSCSTANPDGSQNCSVHWHTYSAPGTYTATLYRHMPTTELAHLNVTVGGAAPTVQYKAVYNAELGVSLSVPKNWITEDRLADAKQFWIEDPDSLNKIQDGYGFSITISNDIHSNSPLTSDFSTMHAQPDGYHQDKERLGCFHDAYTKIKNMTVSGYPAVLYRTSGGCDWGYNYETLWVQGGGRDWLFIFSDATYPSKAPYVTTIVPVILESIQVTP